MLHGFSGHGTRRCTSLILGLLTGPVLATVALGQMSLAPQLPSGQAAKLNPFPRATFHWRAGRLLATLDRTLFDTDFRLTASVTAVSAPQPVQARNAASGVRVASDPTAPALGERFASGALRLQQVGDSLVVLEYAGGAGQGELRYRRRGATPVLHVLVGQSIVVDAAALWATLAPDPHPAPTVDGTADGMWQQRETAFSIPAIASPRHLSSSTFTPNRATVVQRFGDRVVTYAVDTYRLPKSPMRPRIADSRVRWLIASVPWIDSTPSRRDSTSLSIIRRYRLEKRDDTAPVSDVVQPIMASLASVPDRWVSYFTAAIEDWNQVFASIGFRGAIRVLPRGDSLPADSTVPKLMLSFEEEGGVSSGDQTKTDPRSGEVLESQVTVANGNLEYIALRYRAFFGPRDARIKSGAPVPDSVVGSLLRYLVAHEVGHTLGLAHNFQVDGYPTDSLRQRDFVRRMRFAPSVLSYSSTNYVAQLEDSLPLDDLVLHPGPYDTFAVGWGYRPILEAKTPRDELPTLERWRAVQDSVPYLRAQVGGDGEAGFPYYTVEALGNDLVRSVGYGLHNLARTAEIQRAQLDTAQRRGLVIVWQRLLRLVPPVIGGQIPRGPYPPSHAKPPLDPIDSAYQVQAVRFVLSHLFYGQDEFVMQLIPAPPSGDSTLVFFPKLVPGWEESETSDGEPAKLAFQKSQEQVLTELVDKQLATLADQKQSGTLAGVCREIATLERRLVSASKSPALPFDSKDHVTQLSAIASRAFEPAENPEPAAGAGNGDGAGDGSAGQPARILCTR